MTHHLTWALVICTYKREKILPVCLELAAQQTRRPHEVIVIDASPNWKQSKESFLPKLEADNPDIHWVYTTSEQPSSSRQRNQGLRLATADVVFLIDDDSLMYPNCAEEIMKVYEADTKGEVKGVKASRVTEPPQNTQLQYESHTIERSLKLGSINSFSQFLFKNIFLMDAEKMFIPYEEDYPEHPVPASVQALNIAPMRLFMGCEMTFRREVILQEGFEPLLLYYAAGEDVDACYRVSRHGLLVQALDANLCHVQSSGGRVSRLQSTTLTALNLALFLKRNSNDLWRSKKSFSKLMLRRLIAEFLKDLLSRRWTFPQMRGILVAKKYAKEVFSISEELLEEWYPSFQKRFLNKV